MTRDRPALTGRQRREARRRAARRRRGFTAPEMAVGGLVTVAGLFLSVGVLGGPPSEQGALAGGAAAAATTGLQAPLVLGTASAEDTTEPAGGTPEVGHEARGPVVPPCEPQPLPDDFLRHTGAQGARAVGAVGLSCAGEAVEALPPTPLEREDRAILYALVTRDRAVEPEEYRPEDLVTVQGGPYQLRAEAAAATEELLAAGREAGHQHLVVISGYRSYQDQAGTHQDWIGRVGAARAADVSAPPGHSEHQLGLAVDLGGACGLYECLKWSDDGAWIAANAHRWGFIVRYPEGGREVTGYDWEPWHLRYVGPRAAWHMHRTGEIYWERAQPALMAHDKDG